MRFTMAFLALGLLCLHCAAGQNAYVNYGLPDTGSPYITGIIFNDANGNGIKDDKETGIYGWIVKLISPDKTVVNALTAQNGSYIFPNLAPGTYLVDENMPAEWIQTLPSDECYSVSVSDRDVTSVNFGNAFVGSMNNPPAAPSIPSGPISGYTGIEYSYTSSTTDPDDDTVKYIFNWGDGSKTMTGLLTSGETATGSHTWTKEGTYSVTVDAIDGKGTASAPSDPLQVTIELTPNTAPSVPTLTSDKTSAIEGDSISFTATSSDPESNPISYVFDWDDGTKTMTGPVESGTAATMTHAWSSAGSKNVKVNATDSLGASSEESAPLSIAIDANSAPNVPTLTSDKTSTYIGAPISFTATSSDPNSDSIRYVFTWGDGTKTMTEALASGTPATVTHIWSSEGSKGVTVNATDSRGATSAESTAISINVIYNLAPSVPTVTSTKTSALTGESISFTATAIDPESDTIKYVFDWGDGTKTMTSAVASGTAATKSHSWSSAGTKSVTVNATDSKGASSAQSTPISITINANSAPIVPTLTSNKTTAYTGAPISFTATSIDPNSDSIKYVFTWGDGTKTMTGSLASGTPATRTHSWSAAGSKSVTVNATDSRGATSAQSIAIPVTITAAPVNNAPVTPSAPAGVSSGYVETSYTFTASTTDPESDNIKYVFSWGDGQKSVVNYIASGQTASASHAWPSAGTYQVVVNATDTKGAVSGTSPSRPVTIGLSNSKPGKATPISVSTPQSDRTPTFNWNPLSGSTKYTLQVYTGSGALKYSVEYTAQESASGAIRTATPTTTLPANSYKWIIRGVNSAGVGTYSDPMTFNIV